MPASSQVLVSLTHPKLRDGVWVVGIKRDGEEKPEEIAFPTEADGKKFIREQVAAARGKK